MHLLNSSGLLVDIRELVPTIVPGNWNSPYWKGASVSSPNVSVLLRNGRFAESGLGWFDLGSRISGVRGTISVSFVAGSPGTQRGLAILTSNRTLLNPRLVLSVDGLNRPLVSVQNALGSVVASTMASYLPIAEGTHVTTIFSWDSTLAVDGPRFAKMSVQSGAIPSSDWQVAPVAPWASFRPDSVGLGFGTPLLPAFNGQITSLQISEEVYSGPAGTTWSFPSTHILDNFASDTSIVLDAVTAVKL